MFGEIFKIIDNFKDNEKTFDEISFLIPCVTISVLGTVKTTALYLQSDSLRNTLDKLRDIHPEVPENGNDLSKDQQMAKDAQEHLTRVFLVYFAAIVVANSAFCVLPLMLMGYDYYVLGETEIKLPFATKFFFDTDRPAVWPFLYFHQVVSSKYLFFIGTYHSVSSLNIEGSSFAYLEVLESAMSGFRYSLKYNLT